MLILSRKINEVITIGENIHIKVLAVSEGQVKLGIDAPRDIKVFRSEIYEQIQRQNAQATKTSKNVVQKAAGLFKKSGPQNKS